MFLSRYDDSDMGQLIAEEQLEGLGEDFNLITSNKEIWEMTKEIKAAVEPAAPLFSFLGEHPVLSVTALMLVLGGMGAVGAYIGAGGVDVTRKLLEKKG